MKCAPVVVAALAALLLPSRVVAAVVPVTVWTASTADVYMPSIAAAPSGGVYVVSTMSGGSTATLTRYSNTGAETWRTTVGNSRGENVQSDSAGNVYFAGETYTNLHAPSLGGSDVFLRKYSSSGTLLWGRQFGTPQYDFPAGLDVAPSGSVYVTSGGWTSNYGIPPPGSVTTVRQFLADGAPGWTANLDPGDGSYPGGHAAGSHGTTIDSQGNILAVFTNYTTSSGIASRTFLSKTNTAGQVEWIKSLAGASNLFGVALDTADNVVVASDSLSKYDRNGNLTWRISDGTLDLWAGLVAPDGTIYAAGRHSSLGYVAAYSPTGSLLWSRDFQPTAGNVRLTFYDLAISENQLVVAGQLVDNNSHWSGNHLVALAVPEPSLLLLLAPALLLLLRKFMRARR